MDCLLDNGASQNLVSEKGFFLNSFDVRGEIISNYLVTALINISGCVVENSKHGYYSIGSSVCSCNVTASSSDAVNMNSDSSSRLGNKSTLLQSVVNPFNTVSPHGQQKAAVKLSREHNERSNCDGQRKSRMQKHFDKFTTDEKHFPFFMVKD